MSIEGQITDQSELEEILESFPDGISHAFGYGSGVFAQTDQDAQTSTPDEELPMIDLILSTPNAQEWHGDNLMRNPNHYSFIPRILGPGFISTVQKFGAGVYFNPMVRVGSRRKRIVKYGVIDHDILKRDLMEWDCMYIAGRMHKPTHPLIASDEITMLQQDYNLKYAISTALLLLSEKQEIQGGRNGIGIGIDIDICEIFEAVSGLSYTGDPRVAAGAEDPKKVQKLVHSKGQLDRFRNVYNHQLGRLENMGLLTMKENAVEINLMEISTRKVLHNSLPPNLRRDTEHLFSHAHTHASLESGIVAHDKVKLTTQVLTESLTKIVGPAAKAQSAKGLITAGVYKSIRYAAAKFSKGAMKGIL